MIQSNRVLCIIPARKGSKGFKNKNIKKIKNLTLIDWAIKCAIESKYIDDICLSTDYSIDKLSKLSKLYYKKRKKKFCKDNSLTFDVIQEILLENIKNKKLYDIVVLLEPPAPFRNYKLVDKCLEILLKNEGTSIVTLKKLDDYHPIRVKKFIDSIKIADFVIDEPKKGLPRQKQIEAFIRDTSVYIFKSSNFLNKKNSLYGSKKLGLVNNNKYAINIDSELDYLLAKLVLKQKLVANKDLPSL